MSKRIYRQSLSSHEIERARIMLNNGTGWAGAAARLGCSYEVVKRCLDPSYAQRRNERATYRREFGSSGESARPKAPPSVLLDRDRRLAATAPSVTAVICGDPPPGYSALDKKRNGATG